MPNMDGFEASRRIRADISQDIPIIALTADAFNENKTLCITAGMNDFLAKPYGEEELAAILKNGYPSTEMPVTHPTEVVGYVTILDHGLLLFPKA